MPRYAQEVVEIRTVRCLYLVEAENAEEAAELIENGETDKEIEYTHAPPAGNGAVLPERAALHETQRQLANVREPGDGRRRASV